MVTKGELESAKDKVENIIYDWIFSNPSEFGEAYVTEIPRRFGRTQPKSFLTLEYELMQALTHAVSAYQEKDFANFNEVINGLGMATPVIGFLLSKGEQSATVRDLLKAKTTVVSYILEGSITDEKLQFYDKALNKIDEYLATRHLRLFEEKLVSTRGYDRRLWRDDRITAYHLITLLCRDLGFDPLSFQPLDPQIFDGNRNTGLFARHHLDQRRKFSIFLQDLLLTDNSRHRQYDNHIPLSDQRVLVQIIQDLIQNDGSGPNKEITAKDVVNTFLTRFAVPNTAKYYLENYWQSGDFQKNLKNFNERKSLIKNGEYEKFIKNEYNDAYNRFFNNAIKIFDSLTSLSDYKGYKMSRVFTIADIAYLRRVFSI